MRIGIIAEGTTDQAVITNILKGLGIEEIEAWVLTIYLNKETISSADPKTALFREVQRKNITKKGSRNTADFYKTLSKDFRKGKKLHLFKTYNQSLSDFIDEVIAKLG
jgi:hypothetical protein